MPRLGKSAVAGHSQALEDFDRLSALAGGAVAIWSAGSRGPWGHIQGHIQFVCEGETQLSARGVCDTQSCARQGGERGRDEVKLIKPPLALERRSPTSFAFNGSPKTRGSHFKRPRFSQRKRQRTFHFACFMFRCLKLER